MNSVNPKEVFLPLTAEEETELRAYLASRKPSEGVFKLERIIATLSARLLVMGYHKESV